MYPSDLYARGRRLKSGYGEINWTDGCKYKGQFKNDVREGPGTFFWKSGEVICLNFCIAKIISIFL